MPPDDVACSCAGVIKIYWSATGEVHALKGIDAVFPPASITAVVGPSGSGKSSLLRILACVDRPTAGQVRIRDRDVSGLSGRKRRRIRRDLIGFVFQRPSDNLIPYLTAAQHLQTAARLRGGSWKREAEQLLANLGLEERAHHTPAQLSGGEQQRLALASAVIGEPALVLADEPTAELDTESGIRVMETIRVLAGRGHSFVVATHDPLVTKEADRILPPPWCPGGRDQGGPSPVGDRHLGTHPAPARGAEAVPGQQGQDPPRRGAGEDHAAMKTTSTIRP